MTTVSAEALGPKSAHKLLQSGADEVLMPCINRFDDAVSKAGRVDGPVTVHTPANRIDDPEHAVECLQRHGVNNLLVVSGNPGHGRGSRTIYELIPYFRKHGFHVSVGAYPEDYFTTTSRAHRAKSASIVAEKQAVGAQRIITQASFSASNMRKWFETVRSRGVTIPVQVGVMANVPAKTIGRIFNNARAEIFSHPRMRMASKPNLDMFFRMLRSTMPSPEKFIEEVGALREMSDDDGFHIFAYGTDARPLIAAAHGTWNGRDESAVEQRASR